MPPVDVRRFAFRQGPGKRLLGEQQLSDDAAPTTSRLPPQRARAHTGRSLPAGTYDLLAAAPYPCAADGAEPGEALGHILTAAFGLQRREPSHSYDDHRAVASGRSKYPVHAFVVHGHRVRYFDPYRLALVDVDVDVPVPAAAEDVTVVLAARYTDLPTPYGRLRFAVCEVELGINLRSLCVAAELFGASADLDMSATWAANLVRATGDGAWSAPVVVRLAGLGPVLGSETLASSGGSAGYADRDPLLRAEDQSLGEVQAVSAQRLTLSSDERTPAHAIPPTNSATTWADVLWNRSSGRVPEARYGFSLQPSTLDRDVVADMVAWAAQSPPHPLLADLAGRVRVSYVLNGVGDLPTGVYGVEGGQLRLLRPAPGILTAIERGFGRPSSPTTDIGLRHASVVSVFSADVDALLAEFGPAALSLLQLWCGWSTHGLCLAAAAHGLIARPARSYEEYDLQHLLNLRHEEIPVFLTVCGKSRFTELMLDLRP